MPKVEVQEWFKGKERTVLKLWFNGEDLTDEFVQYLRQNNKRDFAKAMKLLEQLANGQFSNRERCKPLKGVDKIFELRDHGGVRIYFFYQGSDAVVLCAGNLKGDGRQNALIKKCSEMRQAFVAAATRNQLVSKPKDNDE